MVARYYLGQKKCEEGLKLEHQQDNPMPACSVKSTGNPTFKRSSSFSSRRVWGAVYLGI